jgi:hypothetical protein
MANAYFRTSEIKPQDGQCIVGVTSMDTEVELTWIGPALAPDCLEGKFVYTKRNGETCHAPPRFWRPLE